MTRVSAAGLKQILGFAWELHAHPELATLPDLLMRMSAQLVHADITSYNEVNGRARRFLGIVDQPIPNVPHRLRMLQRFAAQHPVLGYYERSRDDMPVKISDFITRPQLHDTGVYQEVYRDMSVEFQMVVPVWTQPMEKIVAVTVNRRLRDFDEQDRTRLALLQPHIQQAYVRLERLHELELQRDDFAATLAEASLGLLVLDDQFEIQRTRGPVDEWLQRFFGAAPGSLALPRSLVQWVQRTVVRWRGADPAHPPAAEAPRSFERDDRQLWIQLSPGPRAGEVHLLLREKAQPGSHRSLERLGLTAREGEVLFWLTQGKSNAEIGRILGIAPRTAHKHLEHIYARLGVENRAAAVARALEADSSAGTM